MLVVYHVSVRMESGGSGQLGGQQTLQILLITEIEAESSRPAQDMAMT